MTTSPVISMLSAEAALNAITALLNTGGAASIKIYTGTQPANTLASETGTLLATLTCSSTAFASATDGGTNGLATALANAITSGTAVATGTAGHFRALNGSGTCIVMGSCGTSAADMLLNTTSINSGDTVAASSWTMTLPDGTGTD